MSEQFLSSLARHRPVYLHEGLSLHDLRDEIVFASLMLMGAFTLGAAITEHQLLAKMRADAECPAGEVFRRTVHMDGDRVTVKCDYYMAKQ